MVCENLLFILRLLEKNNFRQNFSSNEFENKFVWPCL